MESNFLESCTCLLILTQRRGTLPPALLWAYPQEFKDANAAGQTLVSPHQFTHRSPLGPLPWVAQGYVVLDDFAMPIIGKGSRTKRKFIAEIQMNARAAIQRSLNKA
ncbi:MAG: hypothetical protein HC821_05255 [Lewinella sp.]|nr:hypothetical protein [Lewinella sp.]